MVFPRFPLTDSFVFKPGKAGEHVYGGIDSFPVNLPAEHDLSFRDVACQVSNRVCFVVFRHGEDRNKSYRACFPFDPSRSLIHGRQVRIEVAGVPSPSWNLFPGSRNLPESLSIKGHIHQNHKDMHIQLKSEIFRTGQSQTRRSDSFDRGLVRQVEKEHGSFQCASIPEIFDEEICLFERDSYRSENHGKFFLFSQHGSLSRDLGRDPGMRKTASGEQGKLLTSNKGIHPIN